MDIEFANRYKSICVKYNDFDNRMSGNNKELYSTIIKRFGYDAKFYSKETFYRIEEEIGRFNFVLDFVLKNGVVETMWYPGQDKQFCVPDGRFDFIAEKLDKSYNRSLHNLPEIFSIYEDLKAALIGSSDN